MKFANGVKSVSTYDNLSYFLWPKNAIIEAAGSGKIGDGKIFISPIEEVVRIRTGETNEEAL